MHRFLLLAVCVPVAATIFAQLPVPPPASHRSTPEPAADRCPLTVFIDAEGKLYDSRFGARYRITEQTLLHDARGGCKEHGPTSSVRIQPAPQAKLGRILQVADLVRHARPDVPVTTLTPHQQRPLR